MSRRRKEVWSGLSRPVLQVDTFSCADAGKPNEPTIGHCHVELDHALVNMHRTPSATIRMQNVDHRKQTLMVFPATDSHDALTDAAVSMDFTYEPTNPLPPTSAASNPGTPAITIVSPASGSTVSVDFTVKVQSSNFTVSSALFCKANLACYGHWHLEDDGHGDDARHKRNRCHPGLDQGPLAR